MRFRFALAAALLATAPVISRADTINVFNLNGTTSSGTLSGSVTLNATTGKFTDSAIKFLYSGVSLGGLITGSTYTFGGAPTSTTTVSGYSSNDFAGTGNAALFDFDLFLPLASLTGYTGGAICSTTRTCSNQVSAIELTSTGTDYSQVTSGTLTLAQPAAAVTPEPSGLILLGTGVLAACTLLRKRYI